MRILDMKYNKDNLNYIYNNILIMLCILEKSIQKILNQINFYNKNPEISNFIKKELKQRETERKIKNISQKDNIKQEFRNKILYKMIEKENKIVFRNRLVYSKSPSIIHNNRCRKKIKKTKIYNKYSLFDDL
jgi:tRNA G10  N-methylase Trm11